MVTTLRNLEMVRIMNAYGLCTLFQRESKEPKSDAKAAIIKCVWTSEVDKIPVRISSCKQDLRIS